jgi:hypothetical protein
MSYYSILSIIPWFLASFIVAALHIAAAVILLKEHHSGPILMLVGSAIALIGQVGSAVLQIVLIRNNSLAETIQWITATSAFSSLGTILFAIGLLLHALRQRGKANRIAELEAILNSRNS